MKKMILLALLTLLCLGASAQEDGTKTGWNFGPLPAVGYSSDLGFQYGVFGEIFNFGDGSTFPEYKHKFTVEASTYTKGSSTLSFAYDSKYLIPNLRTTFNASYLPDNMMSFYGFNGYMSPYDATAGESFYAVDRKYFRSYLALQGKIAGNLNWAAGLGYYSYKVGEVQLEQYEGAESLFAEYLSAGLISADECSGQHVELQVGLVHDTRDSEADPMRGFITEVIGVASPNLLDASDASFGQLSIIHRGYIPVVGETLTIAYRALYQGVIYGEVPFYHLQNLTTLLFRRTYSEALGGTGSLRGMLRNRAVGEGYAMANVELRYRYFHFDLIGQKWYLALNPFLDMGQVVQPFRADEMTATSNSLIYSGSDESLHTTAGLGTKVVMNRNFILSAEYGVALDEQDGTNSLIIGLSFMF
ncbi:MAG: hypothetical protein SNG59_07660 [Rikenellaceae bacterium]